jgi:hypothetical protein
MVPLIVLPARWPTVMVGRLMVAVMSRLMLRMALVVLMKQLMVVPMVPVGKSVTGRLVTLVRPLRVLRTRLGMVSRTRLMRAGTLAVTRG